MTASRPARPPAFQFYPADWRRDLALRYCSIQSRGVWFEMICLMHEGTPYGHLATPAGPIRDPKLLAKMIQAPVRTVTAALAELKAAGVYSLTPEGVIYSRRMVRDEALRTVRATHGLKGAAYGTRGAEYGLRGGRPRKPPMKGGLKPPMKGGSRGVSETPLKPPPSSSSSPAVQEQEKIPPVGPPTKTTLAASSPEWVAALPFPAMPAATWATLLALFPGIDHEAVARDAAAYWLKHRSKYRDIERFLRSQFSREFKRARALARERDPYADLPCMYQCPVCGDVHEGPRDGPRPPCPVMVAP